MKPTGILPALARPHLGRVAKGLEPNYSGVLLGPADKLVSVIEARDVENLRRTAKTAGCSLSNLIQAAFATVLARRGGVEGVYFDTPFASRARPELQSFVGLVCDFLPVRCDVAAVARSQTSPVPSPTSFATATPMRPLVPPNATTPSTTS